MDKSNAHVERYFEFGDVLQIKVLETCGSTVAMDSYFYFAKVQLRDGRVMKMSFDDRHLPKDVWLEGKVCHSVFFDDSDEKHSACHLFPAGGNNHGGMPMLCKLKEVSESKAAPAPKGRRSALLRALIG